MKKLFLIASLFLNLLIINSLYAQVDLKLIVRNPPPSEIYQWQQDPTIIQLIATNQTNTEYTNTTIGFRITNEEGTVIAESKFNSASAPRFNIPPFPQVTVLNGSDIVDVNSISYNSSVYSTTNSSNVLSTALIPNTIPEGYYEICISIYSQDGKNITAGEEYCTNFTILVPEPPMLIAPMDDEVLTTPFPNFMWMPVTGAAPGTQIYYKLKICPVYEGQSPRMAIDNNPVLLEKNDILTTSYLYLPSDLPFNYFGNVERFVWMVQAFDQNQNPATKNQGKSELATFIVEEKEEILSISLNNIYPINNDTVPWSQPHLVTQFTPYTDQVKSIEYTLRCKKDGESTEYTNTRTLTFNGGPKAGQQLNSNEHASLLVTQVGTNKVIPEWYKQLVTGKKYNWHVDATFTFEDGSTQTVSSEETAFIVGLKKPTLNKPIKDTLIKINTKINCSFTVPQPEKLNFDQVDVLNMSAFHASYIRSQALNKFSVEIAKKESFDSIVQTKIITIPESQVYRTGDSCDDLFKKITVELDGIKDTTKYYWRVNYLDASDNKYYSSKPRSLKIIPDSLITCFEMKVESPINNGKWTESKKPRFAVSIKPAINKSAITGGHIKVWKKTSDTQKNTDAKKAKAVLDTTFTGHDDKKIYAHTTDMMGFTRYDLNFINGDSTSKTFKVDTSATYLWSFQLKYNKDSIRVDKALCDSNAVTSNDGIFKVEVADTSNANACPGDCIADLPSDKTPGTQSLKKDSTITIGKFKIKLGTVSGSPDFLSGEGSVDIPYLRANVLVEFNGLKVNKDNEVYEGEAIGKIDQNIEYQKSNAEGYEGKALNFVEGVGKFKEIHEYSSSSGKLVSGLIGETPVTLPLGFDRDYDGYEVIIGIIGMKFTPVKGTLDAAMYVELPSFGPEVGLGFGAKDICFHKDGIAGKEKGILYLAQDFGYDNEESWSMLFKAPTPTDSGTYATWDCHGFNELVIAADVAFPRSWMKPAPDNDPTQLVKAHFKVRADKFGHGWEWMGSASLDECELSGAEGYKMKVQEMVFDYSKARNPSGIVFPKNYTGDKDLHWQGFYIKTASIEFPEKLKTFENEHPTISVNNLLIDKIGFTATIQGANIIQYPKGNFGGWGASIDTLRIDLVNSSLQSGKMNGRMRAPTFDTSMVYNGVISNITGDKKLKYLFSVHPRDSVDMECLKLKLDLYPTSKIELRDTAGKFEAVMDITGKLNLQKEIGALKKVNFKGIKFENLKVFSYSPYFDKGNIGLASPQHGMAGFPVNIDNIDLVTGARSGGFGAGLQFDLTVGLQSGSNAISGTTKLSVWTKLQMGEYGQDYSFDGFDLDSIGVNADLGAVKIAGGLELYESHSTFGDGFRGLVNATFVDKVSVQATAQFGNVNSYQYWYVDAKAIFPTAVPIASGLGMYGFGGGAWYHMRKTGLTDLSTPASNPDASTSAGTTNSGYHYVPDQNIDLGLNASMVIGTHPSPEAFNGDVGLEAQFLSGGGLGTVSLVGNGYMMCKITDRNKAKITADLDLEYNVPTETFHGIFDVDINATPLDGGGQMVMHIDPNIWYMKIGEPSNPITLSLASWLEAQSYLMIGQGLPTPTVPNEIQSLFPGQIMDRKAAISNGNGFAFGANTGFDTGRKTYMGFYGELSAMAGFDMSLLNYTDGARCEGSDEPMGINGWYAYGQIYSYVAASIGLHVDLWFTEGNYEILNMQAGAILQGAGPNPTWLKGSVGGDYRILGGKVKGHCNFHFSMGDQCEMIQENPLSRIDLITDINPSSGTKDVEVMVEPQVASNFELNESFELQEMPEGESTPKVRTFKVKIKDFNLRKTTNNDSIPGKINIAPDKFSAYYSSHNILPGNSNFNLSVAAYGEEFIDGVWHPAVKTDGSLITQTESTTFKTGPEPTKIEDEYVAYSYPVKYQNYFLQDECRKGIVKLKTGLQNLFGVLPNHRLELIARFVPTGEDLKAIEVPFSYNSANNSLDFNIPNLLNSTEYYIQFVKKQITKETTGDKPTEDNRQDRNTSTRTTSTQTEQKTAYESRAGDVIISERKILDMRVREQEKILYAFKFSTSQYNTLQAKLNAYSYITTDSEFYSGIYEEHRAAYEGEESFDRFELNPVEWEKSGATRTFGPLIKANGIYRSTTWHNSFVNPKVYNHIQWMISKNWWQTSMITQFAYYTYYKDMVEIKANGYYKPIVTGVAEVMSQTNYATLPNTSASTSAAASSSGFSFGMISTFGTSTSSGSSSSAASGMTSTNFGGMSGADFSPSSISGANLIDLQTLEIATPNYILTYNQGKVIPVDFERLQSKALYILSNSYISKSNYDRNRLNSIVNTDYVPMLKGNYPVKFYYNYRGCLGVDENTPMISKPFIY